MTTATTKPISDKVNTDTLHNGSQTSISSRRFVITEKRPVTPISKIGHDWNVLLSLHSETYLMRKIRTMERALTVFILCESRKINSLLRHDTNDVVAFYNLRRDFFIWVEDSFRFGKKRIVSFQLWWALESAEDVAMFDNNAIEFCAQTSASVKVMINEIYEGRSVPGIDVASSDKCSLRIKNIVTELLPKNIRTKSILGLQLPVRERDRMYRQE